MTKKGQLNLEEWLLHGYSGNIMLLISMNGYNSAIVNVNPRIVGGPVYNAKHRKDIEITEITPKIGNLLYGVEVERWHKVMRDYLSTYKYEVWYEGPTTPTDYTDITVSAKLVELFMKQCNFTYNNEY